MFPVCAQLTVAQTAAVSSGCRRLTTPNVKCPLSAKRAA
nr:MAG TPA: hypothetical protein [Caudoviricetes sp.]